MKLSKLTAILLLLVLASCARTKRKVIAPVTGSEADYLNVNGKNYKLQKPYQIKIQEWKPQVEETYELR